MTILRKAVRRVTAWRAPHGCTPQLVVTLHPGGLLELREVRRRQGSAVTVDLARIYAQALVARAEARRRRGARRRERP